MATATQPAHPRPAEVVVVPPDLVLATGAERLRKLHAELMRAIAAGQTATITLEPYGGRVMKLLVATEKAI